MFLLHETELLQLVQNINKVTLAVHHLKMTCLWEARRLLHNDIRLNVTKGLNSEALFPPREMPVHIVGPFWEHQEWPGCHLNIVVKKWLLKSEYIRDNARLVVHWTIALSTTWRQEAPDVKLRLVSSAFCSLQIRKARPDFAELDVFLGQHILLTLEQHFNPNI